MKKMISDRSTVRDVHHFKNWLDWKNKEVILQDWDSVTSRLTCDIWNNEMLCASLLSSLFTARHIVNDIWVSEYLKFLLKKAFQIRRISLDEVINITDNESSISISAILLRLRNIQHEEIYKESSM